MKINLKKVLPSELTSYGGYRIVRIATKTLKTSIVVYPATKAPKAATGAKWVGVSYRIDGFKAP